MHRKSLQVIFKYALIVVAIITSFFGYARSSLSGHLEPVWSWECERNYCQKKIITPETRNTVLSLSACRLFCSPSASIWPVPTGQIYMEKRLSKINPANISITGIEVETPIWRLLSKAIQRFKRQVNSLIPKTASKLLIGGKLLTIHFDITNVELTQLTLQTQESYLLKISKIKDNKIRVIISTDNFYGCRHGLESLAQLIIYDDFRNEIQIPSKMSFKDAPAYPYRGILLDTSRNYIDIATIKRTLNAMGMTKMNRFHWHITDSHSFPFVSKSHPDLSKYGAYSPSKVYTAKDIIEIVEFGLVRGVKVVPEFDAPAHVGEGWQKTGLVTCFNWMPVSKYCAEPPCGQFDPTKPKLYDFLEDVYGDLVEVFKPDIFHMGGDEVNFNCWNSTENIVKWMRKEKGWGYAETDFIKLWQLFQTEALKRLYKKVGKRIPVILWSSHLTSPDYLHLLSKEEYIIQVWTTASNPQIQTLLENGYKLILSNYDGLYFDCGYAGWITGGSNWCSPYIGWQKVYENSPAKIAGIKTKLILGATAALWTEQVDSASVDSRLWPRGAALAEVLWSEPKGSWRDAESRFLIQRERMVQRGIKAEALEPEWCMQNEENCPSSRNWDK